MKKVWAVLASMLMMAVLAGCGGSSGSGDETTAQEVAAYKAVIPNAQELLVAAAPQAVAPRAAADVGQTAIYPPLAMAVVPQINGIVTGLIDTLETIVASPYTLYSRQDQMVLWGPFPNDDGAGQVLVVITKEDPTEQDPFEYLYFFLRVADDFEFTDLDSLETESIVIFGAGAPDAVDGPTGLAVFDFDANAAFAQAQEETGPFTTGGFAAAFGEAGPDADLDGVLQIVIAAFRDFVPEDAAPSAEAFDVNYLFGHYVPTASGEPEVDFVEFETEVDVDEDGSLAEDLDIRMAFINQSEGRAEVAAAGGDLGVNTADAVECWNAALQREYFSYVRSDGGLTFSEGTVEACGFVFSQTLDELQIPSLESLAVDDPELMDTLDGLAQLGWGFVEE